ncbi:hypothetical protein [Brunnivagina elsteri]|nr:hypothetical protein [Calothrix elsteri]
MNIRDRRKRDRTTEKNFAFTHYIVADTEEKKNSIAKKFYNSG